MRAPRYLNGWIWWCIGLTQASVSLSLGLSTGKWDLVPIFVAAGMLEATIGLLYFINWIVWSTQHMEETK